MLDLKGSRLRQHSGAASDLGENEAREQRTENRGQRSAGTNFTAGGGKLLRIRLADHAALRQTESGEKNRCTSGSVTRRLGILRSLGDCGAVRVVYCFITPGDAL